MLVQYPEFRDLRPLKLAIAKFVLTFRLQKLHEVFIGG
jgi:hypothetical protein